MTKTKRKIRRDESRDSFAEDEIAGEWEKPGPNVDSDAAWIAAQLSEITGRPKTGFVLEWLPPWAKRAKLHPFTFFFHEDRLVVDCFGRDEGEMDALTDDLTADQRGEIARKTVVAQEHGLAYLALGPDDSLDRMTLAAKIGKASVKMARPERKDRDTGDGIVEEGSNEF